MNLLSLLPRSYESVPAMGRDWFFFCYFSALWGCGVFGRKGWRYSPKLVEAGSSERRLYGVLGSALRKDLLQLDLLSREPFTLSQGRYLPPY
jgi:hypothetical protein